MRKITLLAVSLFMFFGVCVNAATPYVMSGGDYNESFGDIANWTNNFAAGTGASCWGAVAVNATGIIPDGVKTTTTTATFATSTSSGGVQRGSLTGTGVNNVAGTIVLLSTGATDNSSSCAIELFLDFTGRNAGTLSFDYAAVANGTGDRKSSLKVYASIDGASYTELTGAAVSNLANNVAASGSITSVSLPSSFNNSASARIRFYEHNGSGGTTGSRAKISIDNVVATSTASTVLTVSAPTFTPSTGTYYSNQNVSISSATSGAAIYYTVDGSTPDNTKTLYSGSISINSTTTIKAVAYKSTYLDSPVTSATLTFPVVTNVSDIAALRASAVPGLYKLTGEAVLTLKSTTRNAKYVQDATGALLIDDASGVITTSYNLGDGITGLTGTTALYNGMLQFTPVVDPGVATSTNNTVTPIVITPDQLINNQGKLVKVQTVSITGSGNFAASTSYVLNGNSSTVLRTQYADLNYVGTAIPAANQDLTGVVLVYNTTAQLVPRALTDFVGLPTSFVAESSVPEIAANVGSIGTSDIHVSGLNLTGDISLAVSGTDAGLFSLSVATVSQVDGAAASTPVTVSYTPVATGSHTAILTLTSPGAASVTRVLSGTSSGYTGLQSKSLAKISSSNGKLIFSSEANQTLEVYNAVGQKVLTLKTVDGLNTVPVKVSGVVFVKLGSEVSKVIM